jgi:hypothetical protein
VRRPVLLATLAFLVAVAACIVALIADQTLIGILAGAYVGLSGDEFLRVVASRFEVRR